MRRTSLIAGRRMHIIARMAAMPSIGVTDVYAQVLVMDSAGIVPLYTAPEVLVTAPAGQLQTLGTVPIPPTAYDTSGPTVKLRCNILCSASATVGIDFVQLTPADDLCYRHLIQRGYSAPNNSIVVDDGIEGLAYLADERRQLSAVHGPNPARARLSWPGPTHLRAARRRQRICSLDPVSQGLLPSPQGDAMTISVHLGDSDPLGGYIFGADPPTLGACAQVLEQGAARRLCGG